MKKPVKKLPVRKSISTAPRSLSSLPAAPSLVKTVPSKPVAPAKIAPAKTSQSPKSAASDSPIRRGEDAIKFRNQYLADNVDLALSPAVLQYAKAAYDAAVVHFPNPAPHFFESQTETQLKWGMIALAAIGAYCALPYKILMHAPTDGRSILIFYENDWRPATYSANTSGKGGVWFMRDGYSVRTDSNEIRHLVYADMPGNPTFAPHLEYIRDHYTKNVAKDRGVKPKETIKTVERKLLTGEGISQKSVSVRGDNYPPPKDSGKQKKFTKPVKPVEESRIVRALKQIENLPDSAFGKRKKT